METVQVPQFHFKERIKHQYNNVAMAIIREIIQNSRDAGAKNIWFEFEDGKFVARDDGHSMNEAEFRQFYLNLGGTFKRTDSIGGFGAAKELTFAADKWSVIGTNFICIGEGCHYQIQTFPPQTGFLISASDTSYTSSQFKYALKQICQGSQLPLTIWIKAGDEFVQMGQGRKLHRTQMLWDFGFARLFAPRSHDYNHNESTGYKYIRTKGLLTKTEYTGGDFVYYLEIDEPLKIMTENREGIREEYSKKISEEIRAFNKRGLEKRPELKRITLFGIPTHRSIPASNGNGVGHGLALNRAGEVVSAYQKVEYTSDVGNMPTMDDPDDVPIYEPAQEKSPELDFVASIDTEAIRDISSVQTALGMMNFAHKAMKHWDHPFAIIEDGEKAVQVFDRQEALTGKAKKALSIALTLNKMLAGAMKIRCPIPALLFSTEENGVRGTTGPYEIIGYDMGILLGEDEFKGSPFGVLELGIHELAHHWFDDHSQSYEQKRMEIARTIGPKVDTLLMVIRGLQNA